MAAANEGDNFEKLRRKPKLKKHFHRNKALKPARVTKRQKRLMDGDQDMIKQVQHENSKGDSHDRKDAGKQP